MHFLRCVLAEWALVRPRLLRTRLGPWLLALGAALAWLGTRGGDADSVGVALQAGALGAVLAAAFAAGADADRAALAVTLTHPTTPLALAAGRWIATVLPAGTLALACCAVTGWDVGAALAGVAAAGAVGGCAVATVLAAGNGGAIVLFICMAVAGAVPPERLVGLADPGLARIVAASVLEVGPALWHYREIAGLAPRAVAHAAGWAALGVILASGLVGRRR